MNLDLYKEDRDVVEPFAMRLLQRLQEKHPRVRLEDIDIKVHVTDYGDNVYRLLDDMVKESVGF